MTERRNLGEAYSEDLRVSRSSNPSVESFANSSLEESLSVSVTFPVKETDSAVALLNEVEPTEKHDSVIECAVCLQSCIHPVKLPCSHIFCFLCVKGVAFQSRRCAMCRQEIPADFLLHPQLIDRAQLEKETPLDDGYQWFYEGRNGWWQYDERTSGELEMAYKRSQRLCELLIAGHLYIIDFDQMLQYRKTDLVRRRRIKRDLATIPKKGVAGLRTEQSEESSGQTENGTSDLLNCLSSTQTPSNTPQTPPSPSAQAPEAYQSRESRRLRRAMEEIERLRLHDDDDFEFVDTVDIQFVHAVGLPEEPSEVGIVQRTENK